MKKLEGLKVEAIAVEVPNFCNPILTQRPTAGVERIYFESNGTISTSPYFDLPPGEWTILGRADELKVSQINDILYTPKTLYPGVLEAEWQSYCQQHKLTNQLILIKRIDLSTPIEKMLRDANLEIEKMPADMRLTTAQTHILEALKHLSEYINEQIYGKEDKE